MIQRGSLVTVSLPGDYGKPRPALVIQSNLLADLDSIVLCPVTSVLRYMEIMSQIMVDKISTLPRNKISSPFGHLSDERIKAVNQALLLVIGII